MRVLNILKAYALGFVILSFFIYTHEQTHVTLYEISGCEVLDVHYGINSYTKATCPLGASDKADILNGINEIVGYNIMPILCLYIVIYYTRGIKL